MITRQKTEQRHGEENEMCGFGEHEVWRQRHEEIRPEVAMERPTRMAREHRVRLPLER